MANERRWTPHDGETVENFLTRCFTEVQHAAEARLAESLRARGLSMTKVQAALHSAAEFHEEKREAALARFTAWDRGTSWH